MEKLKLPKPELIEGQIDFPEMIKKDFRKALLIVGLTLLTTLIITGGLVGLFYYIKEILVFPS